MSGTHVIHTAPLPLECRVVHVIPHLRFAAGRYVTDTALEQQRRGQGSVAVVISEDAGDPWTSDGGLIQELVSCGVSVHTCGDFFRRAAPGLKAAARTMADIGVASLPGLIVHAHTAMAAVAARWAGAVKVVVTCHGWGPGRPAEFDLQDALAFSLADEVIAPSLHTAGVIQAKTAFAGVQVVPSGCDLRRRPAFGCADDADRPLRVVWVGELAENGGQDILLQAMTTVWEVHGGAELHFIGDGQGAGQTQALARAVDESGTRVVFHGAIEQPYLRLNAFDVWASTSHLDEQSAIVDAMLARLPVVAAGDADGRVAELLDAARCGLLVPPESPRQVAAAISVLLATGRSGRRELGEAGERFARRAFDIRRHVDSLESLYFGEDRLPQPTDVAHRGEGPLRLHLGCGPEHREGWVNIDSRAVVRPDVVARVDALPMFPDGSVDTIEACHLLEHLPLHEAKRAVREWFRLLKDGGELLLELPNLEACVRMLGEHPDRHGYDLGMIGIFGWPVGVEADGVAQVHKWGWTPDSLASALREAGFDSVDTLPIVQTWRPAARVGRDFRVRAVKAA